MEAAAEVMEAADTAVNLNKTKSNTPLQATGYLTLAAVAKCLQAATWLVARGNKNRGCSSWLDHTQTIAHENVKLLAKFYTSASLTTFLTRSTIDGATDSSSSPIRRNSSVSSRSAPSSPQMPDHLPYLWALSVTSLIIRSTAG